MSSLSDTSSQKSKSSKDSKSSENCKSPDGSKPSCNSSKSSDGLPEDPLRQMLSQIEDMEPDPLTVFFDSYNKLKICQSCKEYKHLCHSKSFNKYCIAAVEYEFRKNPFAYDRRKCSKVFLAAYNRAFDLNYYHEMENLNQHATFFPPPCLRKDLDGIVTKLEEERDAYMFQNKPFKTVEEKIGVDPAVGMLEEDGSSGYDPRSFMSDPGYEYFNEESPQTKCRRLIFAYCKAHVMRKSYYYPASMTKKAAKLEFMKRFNDALHVLEFELTGNYCKRSFFLPPESMIDELNKLINSVGEKQEKIIADDKDASFELKNKDMDFDGFECYD